MREIPRWLGLLGLTGLFSLSLLLLWVWLGSAEVPELQRQLAWLTPRSLEVSFLLLLVGGWMSRKAIGRSLPPNRTVPLLVSLLGIIAVSILPPHTHRIFYDEDIYQNVGQNILWRSKAEMCNEGIIEHGAFQCLASEYNKEPNAFPFLLSLVFRFTGVKETSAHVLNCFLFSLGVGCAYWLGGLIFHDRRAAVAAGLLYLLTPENLLWGATVAVEPGAAAMAGVALGAWILFLRQASWATAVFASGAMAFASQWRPESLLLLAVAAVTTLVLSPGWLRRPELYRTALLILVLLLPHLGHLWAVRKASWGSGEAGKFSWQYVSGNLGANSVFYVEGKEYPRYFAFLALLGVAAGARRREKLVPLTWFLFFFGVFIPFHAGSYRYGADVRFSLLSAMPLALLGGAGTAWLSGWLSGPKTGRWVSVGPLLVIAYCFSGYLPLVRSVGSEAWAARADHDIAREFLEHLPESSIVLTHNPGMIQVMGSSAAQASVATYQPDKVDHFFRRFPGGVYFHFSFWCNISDAVQNEFCTNILRTYPTQVIEERSAGTYRYVLHRLMPKREVQPSSP